MAGFVQIFPTNAYTIKLVKSILQFVGEPDIFEPVNPAIEIDENVNIAFLVKVSPCIGAKNAQFRNRVPFFQVKEGTMKNYRSTKIYFESFLKEEKSLDDSYVVDINYDFLVEPIQLDFRISF